MSEMDSSANFRSKLEPTFQDFCVQVTSIMPLTGIQKRTKRASGQRSKIAGGYPGSSELHTNSRTETGTVTQKQGATRSITGIWAVEKCRVAQLNYEIQCILVHGMMFPRPVK